MKTRTRLAFLFSILAAVTFMTACSFSSSSEDVDENVTPQPVATVTATQTATSTGTMGAVTIAANGDIIRKASDTKGGTYEFRQPPARALSAGSWSYTESGKTTPTFSGSFTGDLAATTLTLSLKIERVSDTNGNLLPVKETKDFNFITVADGTFSVIIPAVEVTDAPHLFKIEQLPCDMGIAICVKNLDGSPFVIPQNETNSYGGNNYYYLILQADGEDLNRSISPDKWVFPYVDPNEPITLHLLLHCEMHDSNGFQRDAKDIAWNEITLIPTTGYGKVRYTGKLNFSLNPNGDFTINADDDLLVNYVGDYWCVATDLAVGNDWSNGSWVGDIFTKNTQFNQTRNFWKDKRYCNELIINTGFTQGFLWPYIEYYYKVSENEVYSYRLMKAESLKLIPNIRLDRYDPLTKELIDKIGDVLEFHGPIWPQKPYCTIKFRYNSLKPNFQTLLNSWNPTYTSADFSPLVLPSEVGVINEYYMRIYYPTAVPNTYTIHILYEGDYTHKSSKVYPEVYLLGL